MEIVEIGLFVSAMFNTTQFGMSLLGAIILNDVHKRIKPSPYSTERFTEWFIPMSLSVVMGAASFGCLMTETIAVRYLVVPLVFMTINIFFTMLMTLRILRYIRYEKSSNNTRTNGNRR